MAEPVKGDVDEERVKNRKRFELELEFVQALANPFYLHSLLNRVSSTNLPSSTISSICCIGRRKSTRDSSFTHMPCITWSCFSTQSSDQRL
ncbi:hypothetical protein BJV74DRAFT_42161 [Russula compacta]|nr:hypothetical protein BJV74DRAFT_42161 [Russula compacta]